MNRIFIDLDGPLVDFDRYMRERGLTGDVVKRLPGAYQEMQPTPDGLESVRRLISMGFEVWIASKPPTGFPGAYADKVSWVLLHLPELKRRIILTHDKGLLGDAGDFLIDDRLHKAGCEKFPGKLLAFTEGTWPAFVDYFRSLAYTKNFTYPSG